MASINCISPRLFQGFVVAACLLSDAAAAPPLLQPQQGSTSSPPSQEFEVATIKPHPPGNLANVQFISFDMPGQFVAMNLTAKLLVDAAFNLPDERVSGGPKWAELQTFDVTAKISETDWQAISKLDNDDRAKSIRAMLRSLLQDRFHLLIEHKTELTPVYALTLAKGGFKAKS